MWKRNEKAHMQSTGYSSLQWNPHITAYKRPHQKGKHLKADSTGAPGSYRHRFSVLVFHKCLKFEHTKVGRNKLPVFTF